MSGTVTNKKTYSIYKIRRCALLKRIDSFEAWQVALKDHPKLLLFVETDQCSVCHGLLPQVEGLKKDFDIPFYIVNAAAVPEMAGQLSLFSAPVVLLYADGKEYARYARFVPMDELKFRMAELISGGESM